MAADFQSSFIPKEPVTQEVFKKKKAGMLGVLAVSLFVTAIIVSIGLYVYKGIVKNDIQNLQVQLAESEKNIDKKTIDEMSQFSKKLEVTKSIIYKHQIISKFLESLASSTVSAVRFTEFNYGDLNKGDLVVVIKGEAVSYASVALQEDIFSKNKYFRSTSFSNLNLSEKGLVSFDLAVSVDPQISLYAP